MIPLETQSPIVAQVDGVTTPKKVLTKAEFIFGWIIEFFAPLAWVYCISQIFIFDFDASLISLIGSDYSWLITYKFFIILALATLSLLSVGLSQVLLALAFVIFYPIVLIWRLSVRIFKQKSWNFAFAIINSIISFFKSFKYNFIIISIFLISTFLIFLITNKIVLWLSILLIFLLMIVTYIRSTIFVLKPSGVFRIYQKISIWVRTNKQTNTIFLIDSEIKHLTITEFNDAQLNKWRSSLEYSVIANRIFLVIAKKLKQYENSSLNILSYIITLFLLLLYTICSFSFVNYGLFKIDPSSFTLSGSSSFFLFFYYSFFNLFYRPIAEIIPVSMISQLVVMAETICALFLIGILFTLFFTIKNQKHSGELDEAILGIEEQGQAMEALIKDEYQINSIDEAVEKLKDLKAGALGIIQWLTKHIAS